MHESLDVAEVAALVALGVLDRGLSIDPTLGGDFRATPAAIALRVRLWRLADARLLEARDGRFFITAAGRAAAADHAHGCAS